ncbi:MAG: hypothetical protein IKA46_02820 [Clostridia bacterium]|nr:hypothetical protein [Clostridia bacterium]
MERTKFACLTCLNAGTVVCEECKVIEKPSGRSTRPTHYCGDDRTPENGLSPGDVSAILLVRLQCGKPLPLKLVMRYNEYCVREASCENNPSVAHTGDTSLCTREAEESDRDIHHQDGVSDGTAGDV